ncbi:hypothetical protein D4741_09325 [Pseudoalteromonas gelatinilytica]|uniref:Uncharacterized protein n=1 Tax=Pseudoalteromonas gelatinilytica TaxID=1703256 RepID=A0A3A3EJR0_9GAMM|nr:hypothetical protein D4741_09325 [Pseudoalteromonas profundi]
MTVKGVYRKESCQLSAVSYQIEILKLERGKLERGKLERGKLERGKLEKGKLEKGKLESSSGFTPRYGSDMARYKIAPTMLC